MIFTTFLMMEVKRNESDGSGKKYGNKNRNDDPIGFESVLFVEISKQAMTGL